MHKANCLMKSRSVLAMLALFGLIVSVSLDAKRPPVAQTSTGEQRDYLGDEVAEIEAAKPMGQCQTDQSTEQQEALVDQIGGELGINSNQMNKQQKSDEAYQIIDDGCLKQQEEGEEEEQQQQPLNKKLRGSSMKYEYPMNSYGDSGNEDNWRQQQLEEDSGTLSEKGMRVGQNDMATTRTADNGGPDYSYQIIDKNNQTAGKTHSEVTIEKDVSTKEDNNQQQQKEQKLEQEVLPEQKQERLPKQQEELLQEEEKEPPRIDIDQQQQQQEKEEAAEKAAPADPMLTSKRWRPSASSEPNKPKYLGFGEVEKNRPVNGRVQARLSCQFGANSTNSNKMEDISNVEWAKFVGDYDLSQQDTPSFDCPKRVSCRVSKIKTDVRTTINPRPTMKKPSTSNRIMPSYSVTLHEMEESQVGVYRCSALRTTRGKKSELVYRVIQLD